MDAYRCSNCHRTALRDQWAIHPRQGFAVCPTCWSRGIESMPERIEEAVALSRKLGLFPDRQITL